MFRGSCDLEGRLVRDNDFPRRVLMTKTAYNSVTHDDRSFARGMEKTLLPKPDGVKSSRTRARDVVVS